MRQKTFISLPDGKWLSLECVTEIGLQVRFDQNNFDHVKTNSGLLSKAYPLSDLFSSTVYVIMQGYYFGRLFIITSIIIIIIMKKELLLKNYNLLTKYNALINLMYTSSKDKNISFEISCNKAKYVQRDALNNNNNNNNNKNNNNNIKVNSPRFGIIMTPFSRQSE